MAPGSPAEAVASIQRRTHLKAICWHGTPDGRYEDVPDPSILDPGDVVIRVTSTAICGSALRLYNGLMPTMEAGDALGHETMGVVVETGRDVRKVRIGDRVVVPFTISCGACLFGMVDEIPFGAVVNKGLTIRSGQTHVQRDMQPLLDRILQGEIDPSFIVTHRVPLKEAPAAYATFLEKEDGCVKVVLTP